MSIRLKRRAIRPRLGGPTGLRRCPADSLIIPSSRPDASPAQQRENQQSAISPAARGQRLAAESESADRMGRARGPRPDHSGANRTEQTGRSCASWRACEPGRAHRALDTTQQRVAKVQGRGASEVFRPRSDKGRGKSRAVSAQGVLVWADFRRGPGQDSLEGAVREPHQVRGHALQSEALCRQQAHAHGNLARVSNAAASRCSARQVSSCEPR